MTMAADIDTGIPPVLRSASLGTLDQAPIFHSFSTLNPDDSAHILSAFVAGTPELLLMFEDLPRAVSDNDFQDVVIGVRAVYDELI
jgi:hypothetical protein